MTVTIQKRESTHRIYIFFIFLNHVKLRLLNIPIAFDTYIKI